MKLRDAVCLVTGASTGIGLATAQEMARRGAHVAMVSRDSARLEAAKNTVPGSTMHPCDVGDPSATAHTVTEVETAHGRIDVLFANAGFGHFSALTELPDDHIEDMVRTNVLGQIWFAKAALPGMMERRAGHIAVMASTNGRIPPAMMSVYNATKFAAIGFAETLLYEVEQFGIGVSIVYPGAIETPFFAEPEFASMRTPKKIPADRVARAVCNGIERGSFDISVPKALRVPAVLRALFPSLVRNGIRRYGSAVVPRPPKP